MQTRDKKYYCEETYSNLFLAEIHRDLGFDVLHVDIHLPFPVGPVLGGVLPEEVGFSSLQNDFQYGTFILKLLYF